jgi:hypothetical protein
MLGLSFLVKPPEVNTTFRAGFKTLDSGLSTFVGVSKPAQRQKACLILLSATR